MFVSEHQNTFRGSNANVQMFYQSYCWSKPPGVSHIYMMLIGGGGNQVNSTSGGGTGAVTVWYGAAQHVPDNLDITVSTGDSSPSLVSYRGSSGLFTLLTANAATSNTGASDTNPNYFAASGFYNCVQGQNGAGSITPSSTTFLAAGADSSATSNYGYQGSTNTGGTLLFQPIIVGVPAVNSARTAGIGCGAGGQSGSLPGRGMVLIASW